MSGVEQFDHWSDQLYYDEVGRYCVLSVEEERALLTQYHTCPYCKNLWPRTVPTRNCVNCGTLLPEKLKGQTHTCTTCSTKVSTKRIPRACPRCGSPRNLEPRQRLIEGNLRFVIRMAKRFSTNPDHVRKLISAGNVGLVMAVDRFEISRASRFLTYAAWWIQKEMLDEMSASSSPVHVPTYLQKQIRKIAREGRYVCANCGVRSQNKYGHGLREPCTESEHDFILPVSDSSAMLRNPLPLDTLDLQADEDLFQGIMEERTGALLREKLNLLDFGQRDLFILLGFFNVPVGERKSAPKKLPQLAAITKITTERVRQVKERALSLLKDELLQGGISSFSDTC